MGPAICDRDLVVLDMGRAEPLDDQVFVVRTGEGLVVKRLRRRDDPWELKSDNLTYDPRPLRARTEFSVRSRGRGHRPLDHPSRRPQTGTRRRHLARRGPALLKHTCLRRLRVLRRQTGGNRSAATHVEDSPRGLMRLLVGWFCRRRSHGDVWRSDPCGRITPAIPFR